MRKPKTVDQNAAILLEALLDGPVRAFGGGITDVNAKRGFLMNTTDMYEAVRRLGEVGVVVERMDSGGRPTWDLKGRVA